MGFPLHLPSLQWRQRRTSEIASLTIATKVESSQNIDDHDDDDDYNVDCNNEDGDKAEHVRLLLSVENYVQKQFWW